MGNSATNRLTKDEVDELEKGSHFAEKEIKELYKQFRKETPTGTLTRKEFRDVMKQMEFSDASVQDLIFGVFDIDRDGVISFKEFILSLSSMTRGTPDEKLEFTFRMYDLDADGYITKVEMTTVVDTFFKLVSPLLTYSGKKYDSTEQLVEEFFEQMDANGDGRITLDEFKEGAMKNSDVVQGLKLFSD